MNRCQGHNPLKYFHLPFVVLIWGMLCAAAHANPQVAAHTEATLMSSSATLAPGEKIEIVLRFRMDPGWHVYWKNPGDSGLPPEAEWALPEGFAVSGPRWPYPHRMDEAGLATYGYDGQLHLLYELRVPPVLPPGPVSINADVSWLACEEICVPGKAGLALTFPVQQPELVIPRDELAGVYKTHPVHLPEVTLNAYRSDEVFILHVESAEPIKRLDFFADLPGTIDHAAAQLFTALEDGYTLTIPKSELLEADPDRLQGILYNPDGWDADGHRAITVDAPVRPLEQFRQAGDARPQGINLGLAALFAFLGGMILNLMPCVLPVLSIKVFNLIGQAGSDKRKVLAHGLVFSAGIILSFLLLAAILIFLRFSGVSVGWGFQFQSPVFLILMAHLFFALALNLFGVYEFATSLTRIQTAPAHQQGLQGSFLNGVLATVVATPCTAPFMGSALGYAITQPLPAALAVFAFLGFGMAFPYLLLSIFPQWLKYVPKPGVWMLRLKQFFGFLLAATAVWLLWVLGVQRGVEAMAALALGFVGIGLACWIIGVWGQPLASGKGRLAAQVISAGLLAAALVYPINVARRQPADPQRAEDTYSGLSWEPYSQEIIAESLGRGKWVFVDFTASWCLTCQVNKKTSLHHPDVERAFIDKGVVAVKADWTNYDGRITRALEMFGKTSIPVYVLYNPQKPGEPVFLPEILTPQIVLQYLEKVS